MKTEKPLVTGIRNFAKNCGFTKAHLGLSGGIDSALVAYLAVQALGAENITCINMPSRYSSQGSKDDAAQLANNLGCRYESLPIENCYAAFLSTLEGLFKSRPFDTTEENLQSRIRGTLLMAFANKFHSMLLCSSNKSEITMGYITLYGDTSGALAPIGDIYKTDVFSLCRLINERSQKKTGKLIIPQVIIDKPPSAELRPNQKDEDSLPPYDILDGILKAYNKKLTAGQIAALGYDIKLVESIINTIKRSEFKLRQLPPMIRRRHK